jgi:uncharacterized membrane-anchored protein
MYALKLEGTKKYSCSRPGSPTQKQKELIELIEFVYRDKNLKFRGINSQEAYEFIGTYYKNIYINYRTKEIFVQDEQNRKILKGYLKK